MNNTIIIICTESNDIRNQIMDLRDHRIRLQRKIAILESILFWEPEHFTEEHHYWLSYYRADVERIKAREQLLRRYIR